MTPARAAAARSTRSATGRARELLATGGSLHGLARQPVGALEAIPGVGRAKAARVTAALELARRLLAEDREPEVPVRCPADVYRWCRAALGDLVVEEFRLLTLDAQHR